MSRYYTDQIATLKRERDIWEKTASEYLPRIERLEDALEKTEHERDELLEKLRKSDSFQPSRLSREDVKELKRERDEALGRGTDHENELAERVMIAERERDEARKAIEDARDCVQEARDICDCHEGDDALLEALRLLKVEVTQ